MIDLPKADYGVIVGRFQVPALHNAHKELIESVRARHAGTLIVLGSPAIVGTRSDPLDFRTREAMIKEDYPDVEVQGMRDEPHDDELWSRKLDQLIRVVFPHGTVLLYGGRDSFLQAYKGNFSGLEVSTKIGLCGTEVRDQTRLKVPEGVAGREGAIYSIMNRYGSGIATVDVLIEVKDGWVFGKKSGEKGIRMLGGFFDPEKDNSLEDTARREAIEETGGVGDFSPMVYEGSFKVDDPRYRKAADKIVTTVFRTKLLWGKPVATDDIHKIVIKNDFKISDFVEEHQLIIERIFGNATELIHK